MDEYLFAPTYEPPAPDVDLKVISNARNKAFREAGLIGNNWNGFPIDPFYCRPRGYLLAGKSFILFDPNVLDIRRTSLMFFNWNAPVEVWILHDDKVVDYFELGVGED